MRSQLLLLICMSQNATAFYSCNGKNIKITSTELKQEVEIPRISLYLLLYVNIETHLSQAVHFSVCKQIIRNPAIKQGFQFDFFLSLSTPNLVRLCYKNPMFILILYFC